MRRPKALRVLMVEDSELDARLMLHELEKVGYEPECARVDDREALERELKGAAWDVAILDYTLPSFSGEDALDVVHRTRPGLPAIMVTGTLHEDASARLMQAGAADFVNKANLTRLGPAVERELRSVRIRDRIQDLETEVKQQLAAILRAQEIDRVRGQFVNAVSHELRTPLTSILGYAELLEEGVAGSLSPDQRHYLRQIVTSALRQENVVDDLLDYARSEAGTFQLRLMDLDLREMVHATLEALEPQARQAHVALELVPMPQPLKLMGDPHRIGQLLTNLLTNAIKFSEPGSAVLIRAGWVEDEVLCEVQDFGPGIDEADVPRLFQLFSQLEAGRHRGGTGLGLAIGRTIAEAHGGAIGVRSVPGQGSTFWFRLPRIPPLAALNGG
jgi:signal transduction histidine kinase